MSYDYETCAHGRTSLCADCLEDVAPRSELSQERHRREQSDAGRNALSILLLSCTQQRDAALFAAFVHALRAELNYARFDEETRKSLDFGSSDGWSCEPGTCHLGATYKELAHWRTQAADMEKARDQAQAAELRALKNVERMVTELAAARMPDEVAVLFRDAVNNIHRVKFVDLDVRAKSLAYLDSLGAGKDGTHGL